MNLGRNKPSSLRNEFGSKQIVIPAKAGIQEDSCFSHLDPRVREDDGEKLLEQIRKRGFTRTTLNCKGTGLAEIAVAERAELIQLLDPCFRRDDGRVWGWRLLFLHGFIK